MTNIPENKLRGILAELKMPEGETKLDPTCFDEVAPVAVQFARQYLGEGPVVWFKDKGESHDGSWLIMAGGCRSGGAPFNEGWIELVRAPHMGYDETAGDVNEKATYGAQSVYREDKCRKKFPADLHHALRLVLEHDLLVLGQISEEIKTALSTKKDRTNTLGVAKEEGNTDKALRDLSSINWISQAMSLHLEWLGPSRQISSTPDLKTRTPKP